MNFIRNLKFRFKIYLKDKLIQFKVFYKKLFLFNTYNDSWSIRNIDDRAVCLNTVQNGELVYRNSKCKKAIKNYLEFCKNKKLNSSEDKIIKTSIIFNGQLRNLHTFAPWLKRISKFANIFIYSDFNKEYISNSIFNELISSGKIKLKLTNENSEYIKKVRLLKKKGCFSNNIHQWLKLKYTFLNWGKEIIESNTKTILRIRDDIAFLNPLLLERNIINGFEGIVYPKNMIARSDLMFAFHINDFREIIDFYDQIENYYLKKDWISYPYIPLNPDQLLLSKGGARVEWLYMPKRYFNKLKFYEDFFEGISNSYEILLEDFQNYKFSGYDHIKREKIFGKLISLRYSNKVSFSSEREFAHHLCMKGINSFSHNQIFSGPLLLDNELDKLII
tara:strand:- start:407 stop:1576 length:1170 start_codon:yes stop_codon:yes gene_type:complete